MLVIGAGDPFRLFWASGPPLRQTVTVSEVSIVSPNRSLFIAMAMLTGTILLPGQLPALAQDELSVTPRPTMSGAPATGNPNRPLRVLAPNLVTRTLEAADAHKRDGRLAMAALEIDRGLSLGPDTEALLLQGALLALQQGQVRQSEDYWGRLLTLKPDHPGYLAGRGECLFRMGQTQAAVDALQRAIHQAPQNLRVRFILALAHIADERPEHAKSMLSDLSLEQYGLFAQWLAQTNNALGNQLTADQFRTVAGLAFNPLRALPKTRASEDPILNLLDRVLGDEAPIEDGSSTQAIDWVRADRETTQKALWTAHTLMLETTRMIQSQSWNRVLANLDALEALGFRIETIDLYRAYATDRLGRHDEADTLARRALDEHGESGFALSLYGSMLYERGRIDEALETLGRAVARSPENPMARGSLAYYRIRQGHFTLAMEDLEQAIQQDKTSARLRFLLALAQAETGQEEAVKVLLQLREEQGEEVLTWLAEVDDALQRLPRHPAFADWFETEPSAMEQPTTP